MSSATKVARLIGRRDALLSQAERGRITALAAAEKADTYEKILAVLRGLEAEYRDRLQVQLSAVVSRAVSAVFSEDIQVRIVNKTYRDVTSMAIEVEQAGLTTDIFTAKGGSLVQVVAFALRVLMIAWAGLARTVILDEPFAMVSAEYRPQVAALLRELAKQLKMQFVIVTHEAELVDAADVAYEVKGEGLTAVCRTIKTEHEEHL